MEGFPRFYELINGMHFDDCPEFSGKIEATNSDLKNANDKLISKGEFHIIAEVMKQQCWVMTKVLEDTDKTKRRQWVHIRKNGKEETLRKKNTTHCISVF